MKKIPSNSLSAAEKERQALDLRKAGADFRSIAKQLGYASPKAASQAVQRALRNLQPEPLECERKLEIERVNRLILALWNRATKGELPALDRVIKLMDRRAELLGLAKIPPPTDPTTTGLSLMEAVALLKQVRSEQVNERPGKDGSK